MDNSKNILKSKKITSTTIYGILYLLDFTSSGKKALHQL